MLDRTLGLQQKIAYYQDRDLDKPYTLNGFRGEFNFTAHSLVPEEVRNLVMHSTKHERFSQVPLSTINQIAREVHGGEPGFIVRATQRILELYKLKQSADSDDAPNSRAVYENELTIDDWSADNDDRRTELDT